MAVACGRGGDRGQAFPVYVAVIAGLLFLAFVYFVVGQAASTRNGAQTAADAAALAAAQDAREQLRTGWLGVIADPQQWDDFLQGRDYDSLSACRSAAVFAARNDAEVVDDGCGQLDSGREGFSVRVRTTRSVGRSIIPGTEAQHATASANALIEPKCTFTEPEESEPEESQSPDPDPTSPAEEPDEQDEPILGLTCDGEPWIIDPRDPKLPSAADLFTVRLAGDDE
ncbi:pilus assembly protein TadG-related protein [Streptomyces sp. NPDC096079]|uniref:pilus assembly protein TadG-related protein n=1 Tax=Streptomyces sp. NPDC096079 TaxID=3155820 RepID=UPI00332D3105